MKKGFKVLAAVLTVAVLCTMSLSAFAAVSQNTVTEYDAASGAYTTTTTVTTSTPDEQVAYLVYKPEAENDAPSALNIVHIEQKAANGTTAEFSFSPDAEDAGALIKVATASTAAGAVETETGTIEIPELKIDSLTWSVVGNGKVALAGADEITEADLSTSGTLSDVAIGSLSFVISPEMGYKLATVNGVEALVDAQSICTVSIAADTTAIEFEFAKVTGDASATTEEEAKSFSFGGEGGDSVVFVLGKASGPITAAGMYFSMDSSNLADLDVEGAIPDGVVRIQALKVGSDGAYAIKLKETMSSADKIENYTQFITASTIYAKSFVRAEDGTYKFGALVEVAAPAAE